MNVVTSVVRRVKLDNEVDGGNLTFYQSALQHLLPFLDRDKDTHIQTTSSNVSADENTTRRIAKLEKGVGSLLLLLFAVKIQHRAVNVVQELGVVFDRVAAAEEDNDLLLLGLHFSEKGE